MGLEARDSTSSPNPLFLILFILTTENLKFKLQERIKELECLYAIAQLNIEKTNSHMHEIFNEALLIISKAWQFPEITQVNITLDGHSFSTPNDKKVISFQKADIIINDIKRGWLKVCYTETKPESYEGPFLLEERALINTVAAELSASIERKENKEEKKILEQKLRHSDRLATLGELTAGIAHELNEPLGSILGFAQLIENDHPENTDLQNDITKIIKASLHAREVIRKLMIFSKYDEKNLVNININDIISDGLYLLENRCKKENINLIKILADTLPSIKANSIQINQIVVNLIVNAIHAMPNGGNLILQTNADKKYIYLIIQDNGFGISEENMKKIFDPFFTTKEISTSTGLGLSVVHGIMKSLNGKISVESHLGVGTRFELVFPIKN